MASQSAPPPYTAPSYGTVPVKNKDDEPVSFPQSSESAPVYSGGTIFESRNGVSLI